MFVSHGSVFVDAQLSANNAPEQNYVTAVVPGVRFEVLGMVKQWSLSFGKLQRVSMVGYIYIFIQYSLVFSP